MINYKEFDIEIKEKYGKYILERYQIYKELQNKITQDKLSPEEIEKFCDGMHRLMQVCMEKEKINSVEITGFCALFRTISRQKSYKEIAVELETEDGFEALRKEFQGKCLPYEMLYLTARSKYGYSFVENMDIYAELRRIILKESFTKEEVYRLLDTIRGTSQIADMDHLTNRSFAHFLKLMVVPIKEMETILTSDTHLEELEELYWEKRERISQISRLLNRIRRSIYTKYDKLPDFYKASGLDNNFLSTMTHGGYPNIINVIKVAYLTDTTVEYLTTGKENKMPEDRVPFEEITENGQYKASIFKYRLEEYCESHNIKLRDLLIHCGINPFTPSNWEKARFGPTLEIVITICTKENLNIDYMLGLITGKDETFFFEPV